MKNVMLSDGEPILIDMETLSTGNPVFDLGDLFVAYRAFNEADPLNSLHFIGIDEKTADELLEKTLRSYFGPMKEEAFQEKKKRIMAVGYVRFLQLIIVMRFGGADLVNVRIRQTVERLTELLNEIDGFEV